MEVVGADSAPPFTHPAYATDISSNGNSPRMPRVILTKQESTNKNALARASTTRGPHPVETTERGRYVEKMLMESGKSLRLARLTACVRV